MPGAAYLEMALAASAASHGKPWCVCVASLLEPLILDKTPKTVQTILTPEGPHAASFRIVSVSRPRPTPSRRLPPTPSAAWNCPPQPTAGVDRPGSRAGPVYRRAARRTVADRSTPQVRAGTRARHSRGLRGIGSAEARGWPTSAPPPKATGPTTIRFIPACSIRVPVGGRPVARRRDGHRRLRAHELRSLAVLRSLPGARPVSRGDHRAERAISRWATCGCSTPPDACC